METTYRRNSALAALRIVVFTLGLAGRLSAQLPDSEERLKVLTDPEDIKKKLDKDKTRPPLELFKSQVAPFDILPYVKANHWSTLTLELRANYEDYAGWLQSAPVRMLGLPQDIVYRRDARLPKTQRSRLSLQIMLPVIPKELNLELQLPDAIRFSEVWPASIRVLESHQMLILFLTKEANDAYAGWNRFQAMIPYGMDRSDLSALDRARYYRLVLPLDPDKPPISAHPLTWTTISHVVWDGMSPDTLNPQQQQAMLDWLHWGGQLVLVGGSGGSFSVLKDSFLNPYLPAEITGENALLNREDLMPLSSAYPPPFVGSTNDDSVDESGEPIERVRQLGDRNRYPVAIKPRPDRPIFLTGLKPKEGTVGIPLGESSTHLLGVEQRVGRGRVLMLAFSPTDPAMVSWPGLDSFVRRVLLRRPEEARKGRSVLNGKVYPASLYGPLSGPDLSWVRFLSRDMGAWSPRTPQANEVNPALLSRAQATPDGGPAMKPPFDEMDEYLPNDTAVAEWIDSSALPRLCRKVLEEASGIKIPSASFVLKVIVAYILLLVPLNWLICRYLLGRRELAWVVVPMLSIMFAVGVERAAAYDMGYNSACDEIDVLEIHGDYTRAHVTRFASLYSTGRTRYRIAFPNDPTGLVLPLDNGRSLRGEDIVTSVMQSYPVPALEGFLVQPRSLAMFRAEQMVGLDGAIRLETVDGERKIVNEGTFELRDAVLVDLAGPREKDRKEIHLGTIAPNATVEVRETPRPTTGTTRVKPFDHERFLEEFRHDYEDRPENQGETRLVAWIPNPIAGQQIEPAVDRHRGFTAVVVHLKSGLPPSSDLPTYNVLAQTNPPSAIEPEKAPLLQNARMKGMGGAVRSQRGVRILPDTSSVPSTVPATVPSITPR